MTGKVDTQVIAMGNSAIARGALEGNIHFATSYPGTPASEILQNLALVAKEWDIYVEWSTNEKVAFEAAMAAAWAGLRALTSMKQNGLFVLLDSLVNVAYTGHGQGGLILVVADDPQAHSSTTEADTRALGYYANIPVLEPSTHQEAKDMIPYAFDLSERFGFPFMIRLTTRLAHSQQSFRLGPILRESRKAAFDHSRPLLNIPHPPERHAELLKRLEHVRARFEVSPWNRYTGPEKPELLVITAGTGWLYANETIRLLNLEERIGILRIATLSPLPLTLIKQLLSASERVLFLEEIDPFLETHIRAAAYDLETNHQPILYGKTTGHIPRIGELTIDTTLKVMTELLKIPFEPVSQTYINQIKSAIADLPPRTLTFCPGCPHRTAYLAIHRAIKRNNNSGFVTGDIGCYSLGAFYHDVMRSQHAMGTGVGLASGFGQLQPFGLEEPVIAVIGDSTLFHAGLPALINIYYQQANATVCILDNQATAMTGFQPHPGTGIDAMGNEAPLINIEALLHSMGFPDATVVDPYEIQEATQAIYKAITSPGSHAIIFRRPCPLSIQQPTTEIPTIVEIDPTKCEGASCQICLKELNCPALTWNEETNQVLVDAALCIGCDVCIQVCPHHAISSKTKGQTEVK